MGKATERMTLAPVSFFSTEALFFDVRLDVKNIFSVGQGHSDLVVELFFEKRDDYYYRSKSIPANIIDKIEAIHGIKEVFTYTLKKEKKMSVIIPRPGETFRVYRACMLRFLEELEKCVKHLSPFATIYSLTMSEGRYIYI